MEAEESLVRKAQGGDRAAFEGLVRGTTGWVYGRAYLETGDVHRAEDLVQETFLRAYRAIAGLADPKGFRAWLTTILQSAAVDAFRKSSRKRRSAPGWEGEAALDGVAAPVPDDGGQAETREKVRTILKNIPEAYRLPLTLRYINGEDYHAITKQLGLTNGSLRGLLHRGLKLLREAMKPEISHEQGTSAK